jgi:hypothetical protein
VENVENQGFFGRLQLEQSFARSGEPAKLELGGPGEKFFGGTERNKVEQLNWRGFFAGGHGNCWNGVGFEGVEPRKTLNTREGIATRQAEAWRSQLGSSRVGMGYGPCT